MQEINLTPSSYIVLGLLSQVDQATPYDLKQIVTKVIGCFWTVPHSQVYSESKRLAKHGYITEKREEHGRRRKLYSISELGKAALKDWVDTPTDKIIELRDLAHLKVFFGGDPKKLASIQVEKYGERLEYYESLQEQTGKPKAPPGPDLVLKSGLAHTRVSIEYWKQFLKG